MAAPCTSWMPAGPWARHRSSAMGASVGTEVPPLAFASGVGSRTVGGILYPLTVLAAILLGAFGFGSYLPVAHVATRSRKVPARPEIVWGLINDPVATKGWGGENKTEVVEQDPDRKSTRLNSRHLVISYA